MKIRGQMKGILADFLFPRRCPVCDRPVKPFRSLICDACFPSVKFVTGALCYKCGKPLENETDEYCLDCKKKKHYFKQGISVFEYKSISDAIYRFKYMNRQEYADFFGRMMAARLGKQILSWKPDVFVPVPIHSSKLKMRGYNQATLLSKVLSDYLNVPMDDRLIERCKKTAALKDLTPFERNNILYGAFKLRSDDVKLKTIVLIDDIYTTGATMDEISRLLTGVGVSNIYAVTLAIGKGM